MPVGGISMPASVDQSRGVSATPSAARLVPIASRSSFPPTRRAQIASDRKRPARGPAAPSIYARPSTLLTDFAYHRPPRGAVIPRAFRASAIWCNDVAPARRISRITGSTLAA